MIESVGAACTGCGTCSTVCPSSCIVMEKRELGHEYPAVDAQACVGCGKCLRVCHAVKGFAQGGFAGRAFAVQAKDPRVLEDSSSGGVFTLLASAVLDSGGVVYGSRWSRGHGAVHTRVSSLEGLAALRRSKYVRSDTTGVFDFVKRDIDKGIKVLFVGVPCQVAALKTFLGTSYENLVTIDLVCHGVPSSAFFEDYLCWFEKRVGKRLVKYNSRDKIAAGWSCRGSYKVEAGTTSALSVDDPYVLAFGQGSIFRECCYTCPYAGPRRVGDITLGDFWGVERLRLGIDLDGGVSVVLVNTETGQSLFEQACEKVAFVNEVRFEDAARSNVNLTHPSKMPVERRQLADAYVTGGFAAVASLSKRVYKKEIVKNRIKRSVPDSVKRFIKGVF